MTTTPSIVIRSLTFDDALLQVDHWQRSVQTAGAKAFEIEGDVAEAKLAKVLGNLCASLRLSEFAKNCDRDFNPGEVVGFDTHAELANPELLS